MVSPLISGLKLHIKVKKFSSRGWFYKQILQNLKASSCNILAMYKEGENTPLHIHDYDERCGNFTPLSLF